MRLIPGQIPDAIRRLLPASDPESARYVAPVVTEVDRATAVRVDDQAEREIQSDILAYLTQHRQAGTVRGVINPPMNRRSQLPAGWPDFTFCYRGRAVGMEAKVPGKEAESHQAECHDAMRQDGWLVWTVHSIAEVAMALDALDHAAETGR